jgi:hypothetical protein
MFPMSQIVGSVACPPSLGVRAWHGFSIHGFRR